MGRTIPSFRQLLEIEKLDWLGFKKLLPTKKDRKAFDDIFENAKLYTSYLSNAVNPIVFESVMMGHLFRNYKALLEIGEEEEEEDSNANEGVITNETKLLTEDKPQGKILFDRTCKKWQGLIYALHVEDRRLLLKMMSETCNHNECCNMVTNSGGSEYPIDYLFHLAAITQQQKLIDKISKNQGVENPMNKTLVDFMHNQ
jgi:hypothetical protein